MIAATGRAGCAAATRRVAGERCGLTGLGLAWGLVWGGAVLLGGCASFAPIRDPGTSRVTDGASSVVAGPARSRPLVAGEVVPDFTAPGLGGGRVAWTGSPGRPTVLIVWASWCPHCRQELPLYARVSAEFPAVGVVSVTTSIGRQAGPSPEEVSESTLLPQPVAMDDADNAVARALGVSRYPTVYWVGPDGRVRATTQGELGETLIREGFAALAESGR